MKDIEESIYITDLNPHNNKQRKLGFSRALFKGQICICKAINTLQTPYFLNWYNIVL